MRLNKNKMIKLIRNQSFIIILLLSCYGLTMISGNDGVYETATTICEHCNCRIRETIPQYVLLDCKAKDLRHIYPSWPENFDQKQINSEMYLYYSLNPIGALPQIPATETKMHFFCNQCNLTDLSTGLFIDVPNIYSIDLSDNLLTDDDLHPDVFRGRYDDNAYEPLSVNILNLSNNKIKRLHSNVFEHMPGIKELYLSGNSFANVDIELTFSSIRSLGKTLRVLDISFTGISSLPDSLMQELVVLQSLNLDGNKFLTMPDSLTFAGNLEILNFAMNPINELSDESFIGLKKLRILTLNNLENLEEIEDGTFSQVHSLEALICRDNPKLDMFPIGGLSRSHNLRQLDLSRNGIENFSTFLLNSSDGTANGTVFPKLQSLDLSGNKWNCNCEFYGNIERIFSRSLLKSTNARCDSPLRLTSNLIHDLTLKEACTQTNIKKPIGFDPPPFLRPKHLLLSIMSVMVVILIGLIVGLCVVCIKRKLKKNDIGFGSPIRYTTVRNSTISVT